jgi:hypothetical protein
MLTPLQRLLQRVFFTGISPGNQLNTPGNTVLLLTCFRIFKTCPEISMATHQTARFTNQPMLSHEKAIMRISKYLLDMQKRGILHKPDRSKGLECYVDADFAGGWLHADAENANNVLSWTGYVIMYADCPIFWVSRLQTEIALSTAKAEYIALSQAL